jgi:chromosome segregation ATPase
MAEVKRARDFPDKAEIERIEQNIITSLGCIGKMVQTDECELFIGYLIRDFKGFMQMADELMVETEQEYSKILAVIAEIDAEAKKTFSESAADVKTKLMTSRRLIARLSDTSSRSEGVLLSAGEELETQSAKCKAIYEELITIDTRLSQTLSPEVARRSEFGGLHHRLDRHFAEQQATEAALVDTAAGRVAAFELPEAAGIDKLLTGAVVADKVELRNEQTTQLAQDWTELAQVFDAANPRLVEAFQRCVEAGSTIFISQRTRKTKEDLMDAQDDLEALKKDNLLAEQKLAQLKAERLGAKATVEETTSKLQTENQQKEDLKARIRELKEAIAQNDATTAALTTRDTALRTEIAELKVNHEASIKGKKAEVVNVTAKKDAETSSYYSVLQEIRSLTTKRDGHKKYIKDLPSVEKLSEVLDSDIKDYKANLIKQRALEDNLLNEKTLLASKKA